MVSALVRVHEEGGEASSRPVWIINCPQRVLENEGTSVSDLFSLQLKAFLLPSAESEQTSKLQSESAL